jgi:hypothetical protein
MNLKLFTTSGEKIVEFLNNVHQGLKEENLQLLSKNYKKFNKFTTELKTLEGELSSIIAKLGDKDLEAGNYYTLNLYYLMEINHSLRHIVGDCLQHVDNNHKPLLEIQLNELKDSIDKWHKIFQNYLNRIADNEFLDYEKLHIRCVKSLKKYRKNQVKRIQKKEVGTRNSILFLALIAHLRNMVNFSKRLQVIETDYLSGDLVEEDGEFEELNS